MSFSLDADFRNRAIDEHRDYICSVYIFFDSLLKLLFGFHLTVLHDQVKGYRLMSSE